MHLISPPRRALFVEPAASSLRVPNVALYLNNAIVMKAYIRHRPLFYYALPETLIETILCYVSTFIFTSCVYYYELWLHN